MKSLRSTTMALMVIFAPFSTAMSGDVSGLNGTWESVPHKSTDIDLYGSLTVDIRSSDGRVTVINTWGRGRSFRDSVSMEIGGTEVRVPVTDRVFPSNVFMGLMMPVGSQRHIAARWKTEGTILVLEERSRVRGSQGETDLYVTRTYALGEGGEELTYTVERSSRDADPPLRYVLKKAGSASAYVMTLEDNWEIAGKLPMNAFLISLQGVANGEGPRLYFVYPEKWDFLYTPSVLAYYREKRNYTFAELRSAESALKTFRGSVKGYVVWDKNVRTSLMVAFTVAGLERGVVVTEDLIPLMKKEGIGLIADFRRKFAGKSDADVFRWAYDTYGARCSKDYVVWLGGEAGAVMKPGVADFGMMKKAFFTDLSTKPADIAEYALAKKIMADMKPLSMVMGWHSYAKDKERDYVRLASSNMLRVEGLHTLPNMSFSAQTPATRGFVFRNNHHVRPESTYVPGKKVYIALVQTDGMGLGAWFKPGRGTIPCAWEVTMNWEWLAPAMLEYFHGTATPNDYFVGGLSGPGYMYPKAIPAAGLPRVVEMTRKMTRDLDLPVFEFMDYSEGATVEGNSDLPRSIVEEYARGMPEAIGFINGYAPSYTFGVVDGKPIVSFDYYLSEVRPEADAAADLRELTKINEKRPYFLLVHIREYSDLQRTKSILDRLGPECEVVPLDLFLKLASSRPTFEERFLNR